MSVSIWRISPSIVVAGMLAVLCGFGDGTCLAETARQPNIILLVADDLGYGETGFQGNSEIPTPHLDALAHSGVRLTNGYVTASFCAPSRAGLMTGRYQTRFGYEFNPIAAENEIPTLGLPISEVTIPQALMDQGYRTGLVGKWHLGGTAAFHPLRRGFDEFFGFLHEGHSFVPPPYDGVYSFFRRRVPPQGMRPRWTSPDGRLILSTHTGGNEHHYNANNPIVRGSQPVDEQEYLTDAFTREAVDFIERNSPSPFFLYVAYNAIHSPMQAKVPDVDKFPQIEDMHRRIFAGMLTSLDDSVGKIVAAVDKAGLRENTLIVFLADNGGPTQELTSSNAPLRGGKGDFYEGGVRVPFVMSWPGTLPEKTESDMPVIAIDLFPTFLAAAGGKQPRMAPPLDGVNLLPPLQHPTIPGPERDLYWRMGDKVALRSGDWKLVRTQAPTSGGEWELYNLKEDISESQNVAQTQPDLVRKLEDRWRAINQGMSEAIWRR